MPRPTIPIISRRATAEVALAIIDKVGLDRMSISQVARKIGVQPSSLYHHFRDKAELLEEVARLLLVGVSSVEIDESTPEESIVALCVSVRRSILRHPHAAPLLLQFFPQNLLMRAYERWTAGYAYPPEHQMAIMEGTEKLTFGSAFFEAAAISRGLESKPGPDALAAFPFFARAVASNPLTDEELFVETLRIFLTGAAERVRAGDLGTPVRKADKRQ